MASDMLSGIESGAEILDSRQERMTNFVPTAYPPSRSEHMKHRPAS
jgi:hypothetical protein